MRDKEFVSFDWEKHNGKIVLVDGEQCRLKVRIWEAIFPYKHTVIDVIADPIDKESKWYQELKKVLKDDWHYEVLNDLNISIEEQIINQLGGV